LLPSFMSPLFEARLAAPSIPGRLHKMYRVN
jgi:hypothetical protein